MNAKLSLRIGAVILFLFALGHTVGFLSFRPTSQEALEVMEGMRRVSFDFSGTMVTWRGLFTGFGLAISISGFVWPIIAWRVSNPTAGERSLARILAWLLCATQVGSIVLSFCFFGPVQAAFSAACAGILGWGAYRLGDLGDSRLVVAVRS